MYWVHFWVFSKANMLLNLFKSNIFNEKKMVGGNIYITFLSNVMLYFPRSCIKSGSRNGIISSKYTFFKNSFQIVVCFKDGRPSYLPVSYSIDFREENLC